MPNCFQLIRKSTGKAETFVRIDEEMCAHFGAPCDPKLWHHYWYPIIMEWGIAMGKTFAQCRENHLDSAVRFMAKGDKEAALGELHLVNIIDWLSEHFTSDAWAEIGRR